MCSQKDVDNTARDFLKTLENETSSTHATIIGLSGDLGSGKTTFTQAVARALNIKEYITSPTFVIEKIYNISPTAKSRFTRLVHIDAYRLESPQELVAIDFLKIIAEPTNLIFIEWPERLGDLLPSFTKKLVFNFVNETTRSVTSA